MTNQELISRARNLAQDERTSIAESIITFHDIETRECYREIGYSSLFTFLCKDLKFATTTAQRRVDAVRLFASVPELAEQIRKGEVNLSSSAQMQSILSRHEKATSQKLSQEQKKEIYKKIENKSNDEADRVLYAELSGAQKRVRETLRRTSAKSSKLSTEIPDDLREKLERIKDLTQLTSWADILSAMADEYLKHKDPLEKAKRARKKQPRTSAAETQKRTRYTKAEVKHAVVTRDEGACQFRRENGEICGEKRDVQLHHHLLSFAKGGEQTKENLVCFCRAHNLLMAEKEWGREFMNRFRRSGMLDSNYNNSQNFKSTEVT